MQKKTRWLKLGVVFGLAGMIATMLIHTPGCGGGGGGGGGTTTGSSALPGPFDLGTPEDGSIGIDLSGALSATGLPTTWTASSQATNYFLEIFKDAAFIPANSVYSTTLAANITRHLVPTATLAANSWYY